MEKDSEFDDFIQSKPPVFRSKYPQDNDDRIQILKSYYEKRLENLKEDIKLVFQKIVSDDLVRTMKEDPTSLEFVNQRVREIFEEVISNDREIILEKIYKQYSFLKSEFKKLEEEKQKIEQEFQFAQQESFNKINELERQMDELSFERRKFVENQQLFEKYANDNTIEKEESQINFYDNKKVFEESQIQMSHIKLKLKEAEIKNLEFEEKIKKLTAKIEENTKNSNGFQQKNDRLQQENFDLMQQLDTIKNSTYSIEKEYDEKLYNFEKILKTNEESFKEVLDKSKSKYKKKSHYYKSLSKELQTQISTQKSSSEHKFQTLLAEKDSQLKEISDSYDKKLVEQAKLYESSQRKLQKEYEKKANNQTSRIDFTNFSTLESEKNHYKQLLEEKLVEIDRTYLPRQRHDEVLREKNKIIEELKEECLHKEVEYSKEFALKSRNLDERKSKEYESIFTSYKTMIKESEVNIEDLKRKNQGFEEQNKKLIENLKNLENNKRLFEGKMSEKQLELDRLLKEKEGLIQNLKQIEKNLEEKILLIKRMEKHLSQYNDEMKAFESQLTFLNKEKDQLLKEKEASFKEKESFLNEIREKEKTMKEFDREREKIEELSRKNNDLEQYFQQNIAIFKKNCEVLREENIELSSKLKKKCDELNILESELLSFQKKNSQIPSLLEEKNIFQSKEVSQQIQIRDLEIELQRKQAENNEVIEILRKKEEVLQLQERKITRIKGNYNRFQNKIARNFAKMKEDNSNLHYKVQQILTDNLKEQMNKLASFPNHISKFLRSTNDKFMREKEKIEEKMAEKYDDIMKNLKLKYEENEKNSSFLCKNLESKIKELQNENSGFEEKFIKNQEQNRLLEQENVFLQEKNQDLIVKAEDLEKNNSRLEEMKLFFLEMKEKWGSNILLLKKNQAKKLASIKKTLILIQNNVKKQQENHLISFKKLIFEVFELVNKAQKEFDEKQAYWSEKTLTQNEDLRFLQEQLKENQAYKEELEEKLRKSEENNDLMILDYDNSLKQIQENVASQDFAMHSMRKETEKLKITILELEKELLFKNKELNNLKHEKIKLLERNEVDMKNQALREKEINYNEMMQFKKCIKKNRINEDRNHGNDLKIDVLENKIRELQALNRNIFENKKIESDRDRSLLKSPPIKNSLNSISIDLKDFRNF